jgi:hypothetical protein
MPPALADQCQQQQHCTVLTACDWTGEVALLLLLLLLLVVVTRKLCLLHQREGCH